MVDADVLILGNDPGQSTSHASSFQQSGSNEVTVPCQRGRNQAVDSPNKRRRSEKDAQHGRDVALENALDELGYKLFDEIHFDFPFYFVNEAKHAYSFAISAYFPTSVSMLCGPLP